VRRGYIGRVAAETDNVISSSCPVTQSDELTFAHMHLIVHRTEAKLDQIMALLTPEVLAAIDGLRSNPALKWAARRRAQ
jgi:hypothetical protein